MLEDYLQQLIQTHHRVIVPELGAFLRKEKSASGEETIIFSPFLRFNDGMIEEFLVTEKNISNEDATQIVQTFVQKVKQAIAKKQSYPIKHLGAFYADGRGTILFAFDENEKKSQKKPKELKVENISTVVEDVEKVKDMEKKEKKGKVGKTTLATPVEPLTPVVAIVATPEKEASIEKGDIPVIEVDEVDEEPKKTKKTPAKRGKKSSIDAEPLPIEDTNDNEKDVVVENKNKSQVGVGKIDLAASQVKKWQQTVEQNKTKPQKEVEVHTESHRETIDPTEDGENTRERALKIQRDKMSSLERLQTAEKINGKKDVALLKKQPSNNNIPSASPRRRRKFAGWLVLLVIVAGGIATALWFDIRSFDDVRFDGIRSFITDFTKSNKEQLILPATDVAPATTPAQADIPKVSKQQTGVYYLAVQKFDKLKDAAEFSATLQRLGYDKAEVIHSFNNIYVVCIAKAESATDLNIIQQNNPYKYGNTWILQ
ncbi:hypothetical protein FACS189452_03080 [Bacteroidia bacterium]|nr:hypothetical protein FACS189452_03080 [Bacteroidia bacterium]